MTAQRSTYLGQHTGHRRVRRRLPLAVALLAALLVLCALSAVAAPAHAAQPPAPVFTPFAASVAAPSITVTSPSTSTDYGSTQFCALSSLLPIMWTTSVAVPVGAEFTVWVQNTADDLGRHIWERTVPANGGSSYGTWLLLDPVALSYSPFANSYYVYVAYRPTAGIGPWSNTTATPGHFAISGVAFMLQSSVGTESHEAGSPLTVDWSISPGITVGGEIGFWLKSSAGVYYLLKTMSPVGTPFAPWGYGIYRTTVPLTVPPGSGYQLVAAWRPNASSFWGSWSTSDATLTITPAPSADLTSLRLSPEPANYTFAPATYTYTGVTVPNHVDSIVVLPTGAGVITVNGSVVASGTSFIRVDLTAGVAKTITVVATEAGKSAKTYTITVTRSTAAQATPTFSPAAGAVAPGTPVTITSAGADRIYYTTDGTSPNSSSPMYAGPVTVTPPMTLHALAVKAGHPDSAIGSAAYTQQAATPDLTALALSGSPTNFTFVPATYRYTGITVPHAVKSVKVTPTGAGTITVNGAVVTSGQASKDITLKDHGSPTTITVEARETDKTAKTYTLTVTRNREAPATPTFSPTSGAVADNAKVTITSDGADQIYYTINGTTPTRASLRYKKGEPVRVHPTAAEGLTLKALAVKGGHDDSAVGSAEYTQAATKNLTGLELSGHPSNYDFAPSTYNYTGITVAHSVSRITVAPKGVGEITVNGTKVRSGKASTRPTSASVTLNDAGQPTTITVIAKESGKSAKTYTLAVTRLPDTTQSPDKDITAFSFASLSATGVIDQAKGTISVNLPMGSDVHALIASFTTNGASVSVGTKAQTSGVTANDFTDPVTYTVRAADGSSRSYVVTVTTSTTLSAPTFSPAGGNVAPGTLVTISCHGATSIAYTTDGTTVPSIDTATGYATAGNRYTAPVPIEWYTVDAVTGRMTIQAMGCRLGGSLTPVATATYTLVPTITPTAGSGGTITPGSAQAVKYRTSKSFAIVADEGYSIADVLVDDKSVGPVSTWEFKDVKVDHTIYATFALSNSPSVTYTVTPSAGVGGTISPDSSAKVRYGGMCTFAVTPNVGYRIADVLVDGDSKGPTPVYEFHNVKANHTISASFARTGLTLTPSAGPGGTISPATVQTVQPGTSFEFAVTPDQGYRIADVLVDDVSVGPLAVYWFEQVSADHTISASFAPLTFSITPSVGQGGTISPATPQTVGYGGSRQFTITPDQGYHIVDVLVDSFSVGPVTSYPFTNVTQDHAISASFAVDVPLAITAFRFDGLTPAVSGITDQGNHTISVIVPNGTDVTALAPTVTFTGDSVAPASGVGQDFTSPVTYTVHAGASSLDYTVAVTVSDLVQPGDVGFGGTVAYVLTQGDPGYSATVQHGLAVALDDQSTGIIWALPDYQSAAVPGAMGVGIGDGAANTDAIIAQNGAGTGYAAGLARACGDGGFSDWYLPSKGELNQLYLNRATIGMTENHWYWSSSQSEFYDDCAWGQVFPNGSQQAGYKNNILPLVRAIRAF